MLSACSIIGQMEKTAQLEALYHFLYLAPKAEDLGLLGVKCTEGSRDICCRCLKRLDGGKRRTKGCDLPSQVVRT